MEQNIYLSRDKVIILLNSLHRRDKQTNNNIAKNRIYILILTLNVSKGLKWQIDKQRMECTYVI